MLKVKIKALAAEARIIRREERRSSGWLRDQLASHRMVTVRNEARASLLAYGFIRGKTLAQMEPKVKDRYIQEECIRNAERMCRKYGPAAWRVRAWQPPWKQAA